MVPRPIPTRRLWLFICLSHQSMRTACPEAPRSHRPPRSTTVLVAADHSRAEDRKRGETHTLHVALQLALRAVVEERHGKGRAWGGHQGESFGPLTNGAGSGVLRFLRPSSESTP
jgi:hypothetical protein